MHARVVSPAKLMGNRRSAVEAAVFRFQTPQNTSTRSRSESFSFVSVSSRPETRQPYRFGPVPLALMWIRLGPAGTIVPSTVPRFPPSLRRACSGRSSRR